MSNQRIAIVGGGVGGLTAAWSLARSGMDFVVYEAGPDVGGHCFTISVDNGEDTVLLDPGVQVLSPPIYPHVLALNRLLGQRLIPYPVAFTLYSAIKGLCGPHHPRSAWWKEVEPECVRFTIEMSELMNQRAAEVVSTSLREYFASRDYSDTFVEMMGYVGAIIGPQEIESALDTSIIVFASVLSSGFLSLISESSHEMAFEGGSGAFVKKLAAPVADRIRLSTGVASIRREDDGVVVTDVHGGVDRFDAVIFCVDGQLALDMLEDPSPMEENLLSGCQMKAYASVVHTDDSLLIPDIEPARRNYIEIKDGFLSLNQSVLNLEKRKLRAPLLMSYETLDIDGGPPITTPPVDPSRILHRFDFRQTKDNTYAFEVKKNLFRIQGQRRTWYAGAWTTMSTLEHTVVSALVVTEALGAPYPFGEDPKAQRVYDAFKSLMMSGTEDFPLSAL